MFIFRLSFACEPLRCDLKKKKVLFGKTQMTYKLVCTKYWWGRRYRCCGRRTFWSHLAENALCHYRMMEQVLS